MEAPRLSRPSAVLGTLVFLVLAPGTVALLVPWLISGWQGREPFFGLAPTRFLGGAMIVVAGALLLDAFARFALEGFGTPAPVLPTRTLVVTGPYRYVRNPMYVAVVTLILGQAVLFGDVALLAYAALVWLAFHIFVLLHEEPTMRATYPAEYAVYIAEVRRWLPRLTPWRGLTETIQPSPPSAPP